MNQTSEAPKVYGNRTCRNCKGICHKESWRRQFGERKPYYCSESCLRNAVVKKVQERLEEKGLYFEADEIYGDSEWVEHRNSFYEPVQVISK